MAVTSENSPLLSAVEAPKTSDTARRIAVGALGVVGIGALCVAGVVPVPSAVGVVAARLGFDGYDYGADYNKKFEGYDMTFDHNAANWTPATTQFVNADEAQDMDWSGWMHKDDGELNLLGEGLIPCKAKGQTSSTGWTRDDFCAWDPAEGLHEVRLPSPSIDARAVSSPHPRAAPALLLRPPSNSSGSSLTPPPPSFPLSPPARSQVCVRLAAPETEVLESTHADIADPNEEWCVDAIAWASSAERDPVNTEGQLLLCEPTHGDLRTLYQGFIDSGEPVTDNMGTVFVPAKALEAVNRRCGVH